MEDNAICARVLLSLSNEGYFLGDFWNISLGPPFTLFQKMRVLGDLAKNAITWPFGHVWSRCVRQNLFQSLLFKCIQIRGYWNFRQSAFGPFKRGLLFGRFLKNFPWSPLCTFSENAGFGWPCKNCHNLAFRHFWSRLMPQNFLQFLHFKDIQIRGECILRQSAFRPYKQGLLFGRFLKTFPCSPFALFPESFFGWPCENCHNLALRAVFEQLFAPKSSPVFAL